MSDTDVEEVLGEGSIVIAVNPCIMEVSKKATLTVDRAYVITEYTSDNTFTVTDDVGERHWFDMSFFKRNEPVFTPLVEKAKVENLDEDIRNWLEDLIYKSEDLGANEILADICDVLQLEDR